MNPGGESRLAREVALDQSLDVASVKDAPAGTGGEDELKKSDPVGARPSLGLHPDVSHREFFNE